jgi:hypothetical protein
METCRGGGSVKSLIPGRLSAAIWHSLPDLWWVPALSPGAADPQNRPGDSAYASRSVILSPSSASSSSFTLRSAKATIVSIMRRIGFGHPAGMLGDACLPVPSPRLSVPEIFAGWILAALHLVKAISKARQGMIRRRFQKNTFRAGMCLRTNKIRSDSPNRNRSLGSKRREFSGKSLSVASFCGFLSA